jgi:Ca-activated chloride channel family protein
MTFAEPRWLLTLVLVPLLVAGYIALLRRRQRRQAATASFGEARTRTGKPIGWRRHVPVVVFLLGVTVLLAGLARPQTTIELPHRQGTVILAFDVSNSMAATDIAPTRVRAARTAARAFVHAQPSTIRIGVVDFNDGGFVLQSPTRNTQDVLDAITRLGKPSGGTALGQGILTSLDAIAGSPITLDQQALADGTTQPNIRFIGSATVVLLTDGENTSRVDPVALADVAAQAGVRIDSIGLGSAAGATIEVNGFQIATKLDEDLLRQVAESSNGTYFKAQNAAELTKVYRSIDLKLAVDGKRHEVTSLVAGIGLVLILVAAGLSVLWLGRVAP